MAQWILMDMLHVEISVPRGLRREEYRAIRRTLSGRSFARSLRQAVRQVFRRYPSLRKAKVLINE